MKKESPLTGNDAASTPKVKANQTACGSRLAYAIVEEDGGFHTKVDERLTLFISRLDSFFLATASAQGLPSIEHRGGAAGFLRILDDQTLGFADHCGDRQEIILENLARNNRVCLLLMDYAMKQQIKIWGRARVESDPAWIEKLKPEENGARPNQAIIIVIEAWEGNCSRHIPHLVPYEEVKKPDTLQSRIAKLEL